MIGPSITASGRISALPCAIRNPSRVTNESLALVVDVGAVRYIEGQAGPGVAPVVPDVHIECAAQIVMVCCDGSAGRKPYGFGRPNSYLGSQQDPVLKTYHRSVQHALVPIGRAVRRLRRDVARGPAAQDHQAFPGPACIHPLTLGVLVGLAHHTDQGPAL